ncbi:PAS domain-containing protein, partial [Stenotrophomonas maltophilia]|uniref:PAS domain-containing protein n=2 Tax=Gammaproteobacteria TaxID=1236 RepID=UPI0013DCB24B
VGTFEWYPETGQLDASDEFRRIWGVPRELELTDRLLVSMIEPDDRDRSGPSRMLRSNPLEYTEYRIRRADTGEERW